MIRTWRAIFVDFRTEIGRSQNSHFAFLNIARRPLTKQSNLNLFSLNLSLASCMFGRIHIKWVTFMRAGGRYVNSNLFQWVVLACLTEFLCWYIPWIRSLHTIQENEKNQGGCHTKKTRDMFQPSFSKAKCESLRPGQLGVLQMSPCSTKVGFPV